ncbi:hypothetical protein GCM10011487_47410 [Steroidobacter agaridevorans]|uniref:Pyridoxamine 5'-phosphate oxidase N-terminal domain-containing protein n=1 Tax=Steroidobacter agaridevorans TaxID=2695856 RepID=A0A829YIQ4_9GAMM|nr:hypothetical protein GCM10011487_47410 [Steroidobacter agaridevorans]
MNDLVTDLDTLQGHVGKLPAPRDLKVIDYLDDNALRWLAAAPFMFAAVGDHGGIRVTAGGGETGFLRVTDPQSIQLPRSLLDDPGLAREGQGFGSLFLVPGIDETLRINGRVSSVSDGHIGVAVAECYLHCAKAFMRSGFWSATPIDGNVTADAAAFVAQSRFMALATIDKDGRADVSPKGDPAGALLKAHQEAVWYPDRPGNRRVDSFRNILTQPRIAAMAVIPGSLDVMLVTGVASVSTDETVRASFAVNEKTPKLVTRIEQTECILRRSEALSRARLWPAVQTATGLEPAEIFKAHIKLSRVRGAEAALARASVSIPGMMRKGLDHDYEKNLY